MDEREGLSERSFVAFSLEGHHRLIQAIGLPIGLSGLPVARMPGQAKHKLMMSPVLICLIGISRRTAIRRWLDPWRSHERQPYSVVVRLVRSVLVVRKN